MNIGDKVRNSSVGPGGVTGFTERGFPQVNYVAVSWLILEDGTVYNPMGVALCACGAELHYSSSTVKAAVNKLVASNGEYVNVTCEGKTYKVQRHYIALHGITGSELPELAARLGFEVIE